MAAFEAVGCAKFTGGFGVYAATSGPGAIHLLNGLYDAKLDHVPVVAIVGQTARSAMGGSYQQEVDLLSLFKDVASDYVQMVTVPAQLPNVADRAIRIALAQRAPTAIIIPSDVQELEYSAPTHAFKMVPSSIGLDWPTRRPTTLRSSAPRRFSTPGRRWRSWPARVPAGPGPNSSRSPSYSGPGWPSRCSARTCPPTTCPT
jgi:pyruvate dehydrogenase (quinone)